MGKIFLDTSALYALTATEDLSANIAVKTWDRISQEDSLLVTNSYVVLECISLVQRRLGVEFVRYLQTDILPDMEIFWINSELHDAAMKILLEANRRQLSLVDCSAFAAMRREGIETVFTFDAHFREQGFRVIP